MQLDDEQLGLNSHEPSPPPTASSSRSTSPTPSTSSQLSVPDDSAEPPLSDEELVADLARGLSSFSVVEEEEDLPTPKRAGKRRQAKVPLAAPVEEDEEDPFGAIGIAKKGRRAKGKGKGGNSGTATPEVPKAAVVEEGVEEEGGVAEEEEKMPAAKKSRRAKGKGKSAPASGAATPLEVVEGVTADGEGGEGKKKVLVEVGESDGEGEMSKKDRRKAKEAARKGAGPDELVRLLPFSPLVSIANVLRSQRCNVCSASFPSRSKLFTHIKETGHALAEGAPAGGKAPGMGKKKSKR